MTHKLTHGALAALVIAFAALLFVPASAQEATPKPEFDNAPVTEVLIWAQKSIGVGFIYDGNVLNDPKTEQVRRVTAKHVQPETKPERTLLLFELLKRCGLVAFEVGGMPGPTYHLYTADGAARNAVIVDAPEALDGLYFGSLSVHLRRSSVQDVATRIRPKLTEGVGSIEVFENTHSMIITDYADRLRAAWVIVEAAETQALRDDDLVVDSYAVKNGVAERYVAAIERLRENSEAWKATVNEGSNLLLLSGRRDEVAMVLNRLRQLDSKQADPSFSETTQTLKLIYIQPGDAVATLRQMFENELGAGSVQIGGFERDRKVVFRGSDYDFERARAAVKAIDTKPAEKK
ncbi:MAG: hypothetical protein KDB68_06220 [Planctomycetes bacterium]|nr:hypothetical protein [Planctomycetota bacterium]MCA8935784.1 hypothetical protein [Planctomycetota bacterium]MCA8946545.1 hypothetical protein [Planctomycetota bacterium]